MQHGRKDAVVLSVGELIQAADRDSLSNKNYWIRYAVRLRLDFLILSDVRYDQSRECLRVEGWNIQPTPRLSFSYSTTVSHFDSLVSASAEKLDSLFNGTKSGISESYLPDITCSEYWRGRYLFLLDSVQAALRFYERAIKRSPEQPYIQLEKAAALVKLGQIHQARGETAHHLFMKAEEILSAIPDSAYWIVQKELLRAHICIYQSLWNRSEESIRRAMTLDQNRAVLYILLSRLHPERLSKFQFKNRKQLYEKAIAINPACETAYLALGDWYYFNHRPSESESTYQRLLTIHPGSIDGLLALGKVYLYRNESLKLISVYERVFALNPHSAEILYNLGIAYYNVQDFQKALSLFEKAASLYQYPDAYYYMGAIYLKQGDLDQSLAAFRQRIQLRKSHEDTFADEAVKHVYDILQQEYMKKAENDSLT